MEFKGRKVLELTEPIVFKAYDQNIKRPVKCSPAEDETGKLFTGQGPDGYFESLSEADKHRMAYVVNHFTVLSINDGKALKPSSQVDKENWRWLQFHPYISLTKEKKGPAASKAAYYVENKRVEAERRVTASKDKDKARYLIQFELSYEKQLNVAKVIGHPSPEGFSPLELQDYLLSQTETIAPAILQAADPKNSEESGVKIAFHDLMKWKVIEKFKGGTIRFGGADGTFLGHNEPKVMEFLRNKDNEETVAAILAQLDAKKAEVSDEASVIS